jgi:hypothetical protein
VPAELRTDLLGKGILHSLGDDVDPVAFVMPMLQHAKLEISYTILQDFAFRKSLHYLDNCFHTTNFN